MSTDDSRARQRGDRTDSSIKRLPGGKGWRARPTLGTDPVTGKQVWPTKGVPHQGRGRAVGHRAAPAVGHGDVGTQVEPNVRRGRRSLAQAAGGRRRRRHCCRWHGHAERMTQSVYGCVTDDRLTAASAVFSAAVGQS